MDVQRSTVIARVPLGDGGRSWVADCLSRGGPLSQAFLRRADLSQGEALALAPPGTPEHVLAEPEWGGVATVAGAEVALDEIGAELIAAGATYVIAEKDVYRVGDQSLRGCDNVVPVGGGEVVFWKRLEIGEHLHESVWLGYPGVAFVARSRDGETYLDVIAALAKGETEAVIALTVGAYDAETWIVWRRTADLIAG
jgi:hypothetical protein